MADDAHMRRFWDERARENAYFFVDSRLDYNDPDLERFWRGGEEDLDRLLDVLGHRIELHETVVEIGCGVGRLTRVISNRAAAVIALDISAEMLDLARKNLAERDNVEFVHGDGRSLSGIADASADACVSHVVFQHIPDPSAVLGYVAEMGRVLRPGGWAAFHVSNSPAPHVAQRRPLQTLRAAIGRAPHGQSDPAWLGAMIDLEELERVAGAAGMAMDRVEGRGDQWCAVSLRKTHSGDPLDGTDP